MIKRLCTPFLVLILVCFSQHIPAQKYMTKTGHAYFMSHTDAIDIDGNNNQVACIADLSSGEVVIMVLIKAFEFTLATADKHFNETYMESDVYPKSVFKGTIPVLAGLDLSKDGEYPAAATGQLTIHGQTQDVNQQGLVKVKDGKITLESAFKVSIGDYGIKVPKSVEDRVARQVDIEIDLILTEKN